MKRKVAVLMTLLILFGQASPAVASPATDTKQQIEQNKEKIKNLEKEKAGLQGTKKTVQQELDEISAKVSSKYQEISLVQAEVDKINSEIAAYQSQIDKIHTSIANLSKEIEAKKQLIEENEEKRTLIEQRLSLRIRGLYKNNYFNSLIDILFNSSSLGDFINSIYAFSKVVKLDNDLMDELEEVQELLVEQQEALNSQIEELEVQNDDLVAQQEKLEESLKAQEAKKSQLDSAMAEIKALEAAEKRKYDEIRMTENSLNKKIESLDNINDELQKKLDRLLSDLNKGNTSTSTSESFIRPTIGRVTSEYGYRIHPIYKYKKFHYGIDIAAPKGTAIKASKSGTVSYSGWMSGYGNVVIINHGNKEQTVYAHANSLKVSTGKKVSRGQVIATVGSTGDSTGPHLHFEIRINGATTNPRKYISF